MRCARRSTTARSWLTNRHANCSSCWIYCSRSRKRACTETSSALVGSSAIEQRRAERERAGDADALALTARELVRVAVAEGSRQLDLVEQLLDPRSRSLPLASSGEQQRLADRLADRASAGSATNPGPGTRCRSRGGRRAARDVDALPSSRPAIVSVPSAIGQQADDRGAPDGGLARARLAHEPDDLAGVDLEGDVARRRGTPARGRASGTRCRRGVELQHRLEVLASRPRRAAPSPRRSPTPRCGTAASSCCVYGCSGAVEDLVDRYRARRSSPSFITMIVVGEVGDDAHVVRDEDDRAVRGGGAGRAAGRGSRPAPSRRAPWWARRR